jgi:hypothetical protein
MDSSISLTAVVTSRRSQGTYKTTTKGLKFLDATRKMDGLFQIAGTEERAGQKILISEK